MMIRTRPFSPLNPPESGGSQMHYEVFQLKVSVNLPGVRICPEFLFSLIP